MNLEISNTTCNEIIFTQGGVSHSLDKLYYGQNLVWEKQAGPVPDYDSQYFTIESLENSNTITLNKGTNAPNINYYYSIDDGTTWISSNSSGTWILNEGDKLLIKAVVNSYTSTTTIADNSWVFNGTKLHNIYGNAMSLLFGDDFLDKTELPLVQNSNNLDYSRTFANLFYNDTKLVNAGNLKLNATTIRTQCYSGMFSGCTSLTTAPALPAMTMKFYCYSTMFKGCSSLTTAPALPARTLYTYCYREMFSGCSSLTTAPALPATTPQAYCYEYMFYNCTSLINAPDLPALNLIQNDNGGYPKPNYNGSQFAYAYNCYAYMFKGCSSLNQIKCYATRVGSTGSQMANSTLEWVDGVAATGTFYKNANMTSWTTGTSGIPSGWTVVNL